MKIVNILGGLGNQMFQYALAVALKTEFPNEDVRINRLCFNGYPLHNGFELDRLCEIAFPFATLKDLWKYAYPWFNYRSWQLGFHFLPFRSSMVKDTSFRNSFSFETVKDKNYFDGYWQSPMFFEKHGNEVKRAFAFPNFTDKNNRDLSNLIIRDSCAFIHVRRGDYLGHPLFGNITTLPYYTNAIQKLTENNHYHRFLIFSNDMKWTKDNLLPLLPKDSVISVDWNKGADSFRDMQLMSMCKGGIIANSSFSWWGAWLSGSEEIYAPAIWCNDPKRHTCILPSDWKKVSIE